MNGANGKARTFGILLFPEVEALDFCGSYEVFATTRLDESARRESTSPIRTVLVSETLEPVVTAGGMKVLPDVDFAGCPKLDVLIVPGGHGTRALMHNQRYLDFVKQQAAQAERVASVATGSLVLGSAGLLVGHSATTHWRSRDFFREKFPNTTLERELRIVVDGQIITAASIAAGLEMALMIVAHYFGEDVARNSALQMEFPYPEANGRRTRNGVH